MAEGLVEDYAHYERGEAALITDDVKKVTGSQARKFQDFADNYKTAFK